MNAIDRDVAPEQVDMTELFPGEEDFADVFASKALTKDGFVDKTDSDT